MRRCASMWCQLGCSFGLLPCGFAEGAAVWVGFRGLLLRCKDCYARWLPTCSCLLRGGNPGMQAGDPLSRFS